MRKVGNLVSNQVYNPDNKKPSIPVDADEADSAMERFIRQKYTNNVAVQIGKSRIPRSDEGVPPPLPPKNTKFFRSASSIFPLSSRSKRESKQAVPQGATSPSLSASMMNKPSKVFGATIDYDAPDDTDKKLARLRDMGFLDTQHNAIILKGVSGNLDRAVEALVRLGEGGRQSPAPQSTSAEKTLRSSRSLTPITPTSAGFGTALGVPHMSTQARPTTASPQSTNPFDMMGPAPPQTAQSTGTLHNNNPYGHSTNPFGVSSPQPDLIGQAFQSLTLSASQPYLTHNTGGPTAHHQMSASTSSQPSPQSYQGMSFHNSMTYPPPVQQTQQQQHYPSYNPFFSQPTAPLQPQATQQQNIAINTAQAQGAFANNPFTRSPTRIASPPLSQIPEQFQTATFQSPSPYQTPVAGTNPFFSNNMQYPAMTGQQAFGQQAVGQQQHQQQQQQQPQQPQHQHQQQLYYQPQRQGNAAILALYNQPQAVRQSTLTPEPNMATQTPMIPEGQAIHTQSIQMAPVHVHPSRSVSQPLSVSTNPFMKNVPPAVASDPFASSRKVSRESVNLGMDMAWTTNGRHSPDAFASLSARHV